MTRLCCRRCYLRFVPAADLIACPKCGMPPERTADSESLLGFKLFDRPAGDPLPEALAVSLPAPPPDYTRGG
jgi:hypothetical protein